MLVPLLRLACSHVNKRPSGGFNSESAELRRLPWVVSGRGGAGAGLGLPSPQALIRSLWSCQAACPRRGLASWVKDRDLRNSVTHFQYSLN